MNSICEPAKSELASKRQVGPAHHPAVGHLQRGHTRPGPSLSRVSFGLIFLLPLLLLLLIFFRFKLIIYQWTKKLGQLIAFLNSSFIEKIHTPDSLPIYIVQFSAF